MQIQNAIPLLANEGGMNPVALSVIILVAAYLMGYLFGAIPNGVVIGKVFFGKDPRDYYSHNSGGTNTGRVLGKKIGILVIILDMLKTIIPIYTFWAITTFIPDVKAALQWGGYDARPLVYWGAGLMCAIGHCWPVYIGFKGGKAVSTFMGFNTMICWVEFFLAGFTYLGVLKKTKIVSISSISAAIVGAVPAWTIAIIAVSLKWNPHWLTLMFGFEDAMYLGIEFAIVDTIVGILLVARHHQNIARLRAGTENKTTDIRN